ncbi:hypothetical protein [Clostridium sp.]|jgi:hypothetical protein|uniref:hypothetical protein n=1 Tax=Clostridium sp. TaxID=1506 RepID=UPI003A212FE4
MELDNICGRIEELEELRDEIDFELEELYEKRQRLWEEERKEEIREYWRSVI